MPLQLPLAQQRITKKNLGLSSHTLEKVLNYIRENLAQPLTQAEIAGMAHLSPYYFSRMFHQAMGQSLHQFIITQRVESAAQMLLTSQLTLAEIALCTGFTDQSHLYRHFKRYFGVTPKTFVEQGTNIQLESTNIQELQADIN